MGLRRLVATWGKLGPLGWLLEGAEYFPEASIKDVGLLVVDLIDEVMLAHKTMWAEYSRRRES